MKLSRIANQIFNSPQTALAGITTGLAAVFKGINSFIKNHRQAISIAFWASLVLATAAVLTVVLWPLALATVAGFSIAGISIASIVGASAVAQVAVIGGLAATAASVAVYLGAGIVNGFTALKNRFSAKGQSSASNLVEGTLEQAAPAHSAPVRSAPVHSAPVHSAPIHRSPVLKVAVPVAPEDESAKSPAAGI